MLFAYSPVFFLLICCSYDIIIEYLFYYFLFLLGIVLHAYAGGICVAGCYLQTYICDFKACGYATGLFFCFYMYVSVL